MTFAAVRTIDPREYVPHELHRKPRAWGESNCYIDVWIEVLHMLGCEPYACLPFVFTIDWDCDQFTFFKPPLGDLFTLYGIDVQELNVYRSLLDDAREQLAAGRLVLAEADAYFLPDTAGTDYRTQHTKTTIGLQEVDLDRKALGYFHNSSYHRLSGADFVALFRLDAPHDPAYMPFFAELVRTSRVFKLEPRALAARSVHLLKSHLARRPVENPVHKFAERLDSDMARLYREGLAQYHAYAFATIRQLGAAFELGALYLEWLTGQGERGLEESAASFSHISEVCKSLVLKGARAVTRQQGDFSPMLVDVARHWSSGIDGLACHFGA